MSVIFDPPASVDADLPVIYGSQSKDGDIQTATWHLIAVNLTRLQMLVYISTGKVVGVNLDPADAGIIIKSSAWVGTPPPEVGND